MRIRLPSGKVGFIPSSALSNTATIDAGSHASQLMYFVRFEDRATTLVFPNLIGSEAANPSSLTST